MNRLTKLALLVSGVLLTITVALYAQDPARFLQAVEVHRGRLLLGKDINIEFDGTTVDGFSTILTVIDPTADRTLSLPNDYVTDTMLGRRLPRTAVTGNYTALSTDYYLEVTTYTGTLLINLPTTRTTLGTGFSLIIKDAVGLVRHDGHTITIGVQANNAGGMIDNVEATTTLPNAFSVIKLVVGVTPTGNFQWYTTQ